MALHVDDAVPELGRMSRKAGRCVVASRPKPSKSGTSRDGAASEGGRAPVRQVL